MSFLSPYMEPSTSQNSFQIKNEYNPESQNEENDKNMTDDVETRNKEDSDEDRTTSISIIRPTEPPAVQSDYIDLFFVSLAKTVQKLPQNERVYLRLSISKLIFEAKLRNLSSVTQSQPMTFTMPDPSPAQFSSANSYSNESETFIQSPSAPH
ncbi:hypothetical protein FQA39_LY17269 [Lamprigera yunnana]|nr:hypothetical protein FQA39_LY17269 [Lamprigera yunnana]